MKVLTVHQPWAWALVHGLKPVENRSWRLPPSLLGRWVAIHAGQAFDRADFAKAAAWSGHPVEDVGVWETGGVVTGAIIGAVRFLGVVRAGEQTYPDETPMAVETLTHGPGDMATVDRWRVESRSCPWWTGPMGWVVGESVVFDPIAAKGKLGLWALDQGTEKTVRERVDSAAEAVL